MPGCSTGRNIQKYKGAAASTLQDVTDNGNTTTGDIITTIGNIYVSNGYYIGDGSLLTGIAGASSAFSFQDTSDRGNTTSNTIQFTNTITSLTTSGNVIVAGNVTASSFYGLGSGLSSLNASNISSGTLSNDRLDTKTGTGNIVMSASPTLSGTITGGTFSGTHTGTGSGLSSLNASNISSGTLSVARGGTGTDTSTGTGSVVLNNSPIFIGTVSGGTFSGTHTGTGSGLTSLNASNISTGTLSVSRGGTGTTTLDNLITLGSHTTGNYVKTVTAGNGLDISGSAGEGSDHTLSLDLKANHGLAIDNTELKIDLKASGGLEFDSGKLGVKLDDNNINGTLPVSKGGTDITTYNTGDILIASTTNTLTTLALGADSHVLTANTSTGKPEWKSASAIGTTVATLSNTAYIIGGSYNGGSAKTWSLKASTANSTDHIVIRDNSGDIYAREYHGDYIKHAGDTDTHLGFPSDDTLTITTAGTERMKFDSSGRTLIPNYFTHSGDTNTYFGFPTSDTFKIRTAGTDRFRIDSGGDVGIGVSNPVYKLDVAGNMNLTSGLYLDGGAGGNGQVLTSSAGGLMTWTTPSTNAATATKLATARNIGGVSFDGSASINLPGVNQAGNQNTSGNAATATKLASAVNIGGVPFDGSTSINLPGVDISGSQDTTGEAGSIANVPDTASSSERSVAFLNGNQVKTNTNLTFKPTSNELKLTNLKITGALTAGSGTGINGQVLKSTGTGVVWGTDNTGGSGSGSSVWLQSGSTPNFIVTTPTPQSNVGISNIYPVEHTLHIGSNVIVSDTGGHDVLRVNGNVFCTNYLFGDGSKIRNLNTIRTETGSNQISVGGNDGGPVLSWRERQIRYQQGCSNRPVPPGYGF